jgi:hypothetical protein
MRYADYNTIKQEETALQNLARGLNVRCECRVQSGRSSDDYRQCKRRAVTVNRCGAFTYSCRQHKYVSAN